MPNVTWPYPKDGKNYPGTNFSFHRFAIPKLMGYKGRALYVDADMLVLRDIAELWNTPFNGAAVLCAASSDPGRRRQLSVMLLDCANLDWDVDKIITEGLDKGKFNYDELIYGLCIEPAERVKDALPPEWNSLEKYEPGKTCLLHYTEMERQPWLSFRNRNGWLWLEYLRDAIRDGAVTWDEVNEAVARAGRARPCRAFCERRASCGVPLTSTSPAELIKALCRIRNLESVKRRRGEPSRPRPPKETLI
jgi:lipopolysaccharide biosynthesis glycosyltransferase